MILFRVLVLISQFLCVINMVMCSLYFPGNYIECRRCSCMAVGPAVFREGSRWLSSTAVTRGFDRVFVRGASYVRVVGFGGLVV